jgi:hypothetical protein
MPLTQCTKNGTRGWRWGAKGACYTGPGAKKKALKQGLAENNGDENKFKADMAKAGLLDDKDVQAFLESVSEPQGADRYLTAIAAYCEEKDWAVAYVSKEERDKIPLANFADPKNRKFPINNQDHLDAAVKLVGRESPSAQAAIKARIKSIAKRLGLKLPASWGGK